MALWLYRDEEAFEADRAGYGRIRRTEKPREWSAPHMSDIDSYHALAKDAGNRLRSYVLSVASGGTGVFFFALTGADEPMLSQLERYLLLIALVSFILTVFLCLYELRVDARRFFGVATELAKESADQNWSQNEEFKRERYWLIHASYGTLAIGVLTTGFYLASRLFWNE